VFVAGNATRSFAPEWVDSPTGIGDDGLAPAAETGAGTVFLRGSTKSTGRAMTAPRLSRGAGGSPATSAAAGRDARPPRDLVAGPALPEPVETEESAPAEESGASPGLAQATPKPLLATPMPNATANPPTRPTYADARTPLPPTNHGQTDESDSRQISEATASPTKEKPRTAARPKHQALPPNPSCGNHRTYTATARAAETTA
jgi:hypothetical protein